MVVETSALLAVFFKEAEEDAFKAKIETSKLNYVSACSLLEAYAKVLGQRDEAAAAEFMAFAETLKLEIVPFDSRQMAFAQSAYLRFGRGRGHAAKLNFGDCISYGLAMALNQPLLFKGNDFIHTDVLKA